MNFIASVFNPHIREWEATDFACSFIVPTWTLFLYRTTVALLAITIYIADYSIDNSAPFFYTYFYLTTLSWIGTAAFVTALFLFRDKGDPTRLNSQIGILKWLHWNLYIVQFVYQPIVVAVYWLLLSAGALSKPPVLVFFNIFKHGLLFGFMYLDFILNRIPLYASQVWTPLIVGLIYFAWGEIQALIVKGFFAYFFLDLSNASSKYVIVGVFVVLVIVFYVNYGITLLRDKIAGRKRVTAADADIRMEPLSA